VDKKIVVYFLVLSRQSPRWNAINHEDLFMTADINTYEEAASGIKFQIITATKV
jgi:hypothetical protein